MISDWLASLLQCAVQVKVDVQVIVNRSQHSPTPANLVLYDRNMVMVMVT